MKLFFEKHMPPCLFDLLVRTIHERSTCGCMGRVIQNDTVAVDVPVVVRCVRFAIWHLLLSRFVICFVFIILNLVGISRRNKAKKIRELPLGEFTYCLCQMYRFMPRCSSRWRVYRGSNRIRGIRGDTLLELRNCCKWWAVLSPGRHVFCASLCESARICVLDVAYYYYFCLFFH